MENPRISVIVPVYNTEKYIEKCLDSILGQTYRNLEIIVVDDGSKDSCPEIIRAYAQKDSRIVPVFKENGGSSSARNLALKKATGDYFAFVDSDDFLSADMYERLVAGIESGREIIQAGREEIAENGEILPDICETPSETVKYSSRDFIFELLMHRGDCSFCTKIVPRELFCGREFPVGKLNEDFILLIKMLESGASVISLPFKGYHVFYRSNSNSRKEKPGEFSRVYADCVDNADYVFGSQFTKSEGLMAAALRFSVFQRLEYLLHIPVSQMNRNNRFYLEVVKWLRRHWLSGVGNSLLTRKNKAYMTLFALCPAFVRKVHAKMKGIPLC